MNMELIRINVITFLYDHSPKPRLQNAIQTAPAFAYDRREVPFFNVWLPEIRSLAARGNCLIPHALASDFDVARDEEADDTG